MIYVPAAYAADAILEAEDAGVAAETAIREIKRAVGPARWLVGLYRGR